MEVVLPQLVDGRSGRPGDPGLSQREIDVLQYAAKGFSYDEIAGLLYVTRHTVMTYVPPSYRKLQVHSRTEALHEARLLGLLRD